MSDNKDFLEKNQDTEAAFIQKDAPKINFLGMKIDTMGLIYNTSFIILWVLLWKFLRMSETNCWPIKIFFWFVIISRFVILYIQQDETIAYITEEDYYLTAVQQKMLVFFGTTFLIVLVYLYKHNFSINTKHRTEYLILAVVNIILLLISLDVPIPNSANSFRNYRLYIATFGDVSLYLLMLFLIKLYCDIK